VPHGTPVAKARIRIVDGEAGIAQKQKIIVFSENNA
jgi:hypothetical protein